MNTSPYIIWTGWLAVLLCVGISLLAPEFTLENLLIALFAVSTEALWKKPEFPHRENGLATSWIGPLLMAGWQVMYLLLIKPHFDTSATQMASVSTTNQMRFNLLLLQLFLQGCVSTLFFLWVFRGYGVVGVIALLETVWHRPVRLRLQNPSSAVTLRGLITVYPFAIWWVPVTSVLLMHSLKGLIVFWMVRQMAW